jgi:hypothetical protein
MYKVKFYLTGGQTITFKTPQYDVNLDNGQICSYDLTGTTNYEKFGFNMREIAGVTARKCWW